MANNENLKPFVPGTDERRNLEGRPVGSKNRSTIAKKWLEVELNERNPLTGLAEKLSYEDIITLTQIKKAQYDEDTLAYKALMDSAYGAPKQEHDMDIKAELNIPAPIVYNQAPPLVNSENDVDNV
jgi:hypothetical protein